MAWRRKFYLELAEISSFVYLVQFKDGRRRVGPRLLLFVSDVNPGTKIFMCKRVGAEIYLRGTRD